MDEQHLAEVPFSSLDLPDELRQSIRDAGFTHCTPIQAKALPIGLAGRDVAGQAQTGTGKTAAFLLATFTRLIRHPARAGRTPTQPRALILAPTRELAIQIHKDALALGKYTQQRLALIYGGTGYDSQREQLRAGVDIIIGTPGRIIDYMKQHIFDLKALDVIVLDEADRMFDLGFIKDIRYILRRAPRPEERLSMLFSATLSYRVTELAYEHMNNPELVKTEDEKVTAQKVREIMYYIGRDEKIPLLLGLLKTMDPSRSMLFVNTKRAADRVAAYLQGNGYKAAALSGDVPQNRRQRYLAEFEQGKLQILVATDVAARGLHIPDVSHVFNFDLPQDAEDYVHRIGRTARAGASGDAISFACEEYAFSLPAIEAYIGYKIPGGRITDDLLIKPSPPAPGARKRTPPHGRGAKPKGSRPPRRPKTAGTRRR